MSAADTPAIEIRNLVRRYGRTGAWQRVITRLCKATPGLDRAELFRRRPRVPRHGGHS